MSTSRSLASILGPSSDRYFGAGYTRVAPGVSRVEAWVRSGEHWVAEGIAEVRVDGRWSRKAMREAVPHVSTIDVISIALQASELALTRFSGETMWSLSVIEVKAPPAPIEDGFDRIAFSIAYVQHGEVVTTESLISGFTVVATIVSAHGTSNGAPARIYGDVFRRRSPEVDLIDRSPGGVRTTTRVAPTQTPVGGVLDSRRGDGLNAIDAFVVALQLGQVLLYELDRMSRAESDTLWMRTARIVASGAVAHDSDVIASLENCRVRALRGDDWRLATLRGSLLGLFEVSCGLAHRLPAGRRSRPQTQHERGRPA